MTEKSRAPKTVSSTHRISRALVLLGSTGLSFAIVYSFMNAHGEPLADFRTETTVHESAPEPETTTHRSPAAQPSTTEAAFAAALADLRQALASNRGGPEAAAATRRAMRLDPAAFAAATGMLLDQGTDRELRQALAMILGTIANPETDRVLLDALSDAGGDEELCLCLIAALGAMREPASEDDVFDLEAAPFYGKPGPGGIGITVRRRIDDPAVQKQLGALLLDGSRPAVRRASADALRFSLAHRACRDSFRAAARIESRDSTASILAEELGRWARRHTGPESEQIARTLVARADQPGFEEYRLRLETAIEGLPLGVFELERVRSWTAHEQPFELRAFAYTLLCRQPTLAPADRTLLEAALYDPDAPVRDLAARLLGTVPSTPGTVRALRTVYYSSEAWNLRTSALTALVALLPTAQARELVTRATTDPDPRIARCALRLRRLVGS